MEVIVWKDYFSLKKDLFVVTDVEDGFVEIAYVLDVDVVPHVADVSKSVGDSLFFTSIFKQITNFF